MQSTSTTNSTAPVGLISSAASQRLLVDRREVQVTTPWGVASVLTGRIGGREAVVVLRYGPKLTIPSHKINYQANIWALRELGVERVISQNAIGSVNPVLRPGDIVTALDGKPVIDTRELIERISAIKPGGQGELTVQRAGSEQKNEQKKVRPFGRT